MSSIAPPLIRGLGSLGDSGFGAKRPFTDEYLRLYSKQHLLYECDAILWAVDWWGREEDPLKNLHNSERARLNNLLLTGFVVHVRNMIEFLYSQDPRPTDVVAADYCPQGHWAAVRPGMPTQLKEARTRGHMEIAHLTTARYWENVPDKAWKVKSLVHELKEVMFRWSNEAILERVDFALLHRLFGDVPTRRED